jgi:hypothetical protein
VPIFPPVPAPYVLLTPAELAAFGIGLSHAPTGYDDDEKASNDDAETEDNE